MDNRRRTWPLAIALLIMALASSLVAGCQTKVITTPAGQPPNTVTASGTGKTMAVPDEASMTFGVTRRNANAKKALNEASKVAEDITAAVKKAGVDAKDIQTSNVSVYPQQTDRDGKVVITGYEASISVTAKIKDIGTLGDVIAAANDAGADTISGPAFTISEDSEYRAKAIDDAVAQARKSAEAMAAAADKSVGEVLSLSSANVSVPAAAGRLRVRRQRCSGIGADRARPARGDRRRDRGLRAELAACCATLPPKGVVQIRTVIGVMGGGTCDEATRDAAYELGRLIADSGWVLLNGGRDAGVMAASAQGAADAGGLVIGVLPTDDWECIAAGVDVPVLTGMGDARNAINVLSSRVVVALPGGAGTLSEVALALKAGRRVITLGFSLRDCHADYYARGRIVDTATPEEAVAAVRWSLGEEIEKA